MLVLKTLSAVVLCLHHCLAGKSFVQLSICVYVRITGWYCYMSLLSLCLTVSLHRQALIVLINVLRASIFSLPM